MGRPKGSINKFSSKLSVNCLKCNSPFRAYPSRVKVGKGKYCSLDCYRAAIENKTQCICRACTKAYEVDASQGGKLFCSWDCYITTVDKVNLRNSDWDSKYIEYRVDCVCLTCAKPFKVSKARFDDNRGKYCSKVCYSESMRLPAGVLKENRRKYINAYRKAHPEWTAECKQRRRAIENNAEGHFTAQEWIDLKKKFGNKCAICGEAKKLTVDHIIPLSRGGSNYIENIQGLCGSCNSRKWAKLSNALKSVRYPEGITKDV